jgi:hypothetical protein
MKTRSGAREKLENNFISARKGEMREAKKKSERDEKVFSVS